MIEVLPDVLAPNLNIVFCGTAAGRRSAQVRAYYAGRGNRFWQTLYRTGLTPRQLEPGEYGELPGYGIGLTDLAKNHAGSDRSIPSPGYNVQAFKDRILAYSPQVVAFNGKEAARKVFGRPRVDYGLQVEMIGNSRLYVLPSTSGAARGSWDESYWRELAEAVAFRRRTGGVKPSCLATTAFDASWPRAL